MTYEEAEALFRRGHLRALADSYRKGVTTQRSLEPRLRVLLAYSLALADDTSQASALLDLDLTKLSTGVRSQAETTLGLINSRTGDRESTWQHLNSGLRLARETDDAEKIAWTTLHLFRFAIDAQTPDVLMGILRDVRAAVVRVGVPYLTAYLHVCVSVLEGQRGHLDEAWRHCDIAEALLRLESNAWVLGSLLVNRGCIACLRCDFDSANRYNSAAMELAGVSGSSRSRAAAQITSGHIHMLAGNFELAQQILVGAIDEADNEGLRTIGAADSLARVYLALGELDKCEEALELVKFSLTDAAANSTYAKRWATLTRGKLLLRKRQFKEAVNWLDGIDTQARPLGDGPFTAAVQLLTSEALARAERSSECARRIIRADVAGIMEQRDFQGQYFSSMGRIARSWSLKLSLQMKERARRIWSIQGIASTSAELDDGDEDAFSNSRVEDHKDDIRCVVSSLASLFALSYDTKLVGAEALCVLDSLHLPKGRLIESSSTKSSSSTTVDKVLLSLGGCVEKGKFISLVCEQPKNPLEAMLLADVLRLTRAALDLEVARREKCSRAAVWPATPGPEETGALFIADEMQTLVDTAQRVATANIPVLITGETGTGKEVLARLIHGHSPRAGKPFLPFNCTATPREMLDAQLFGHRKGAFTGALENFSGVIRAAAGGTLFLDEIGESTLEIQPKLLRFLESGEVHPIGETHPQRVDVRVLAATNADVDELVAQGRFREDLFYRLNIVRLHIPPLRERRVEIPSFANHYLQRYAKECGKGSLRLSEETMEYMVLYRWPGNVRQLANEMRRLAALAAPGAVLMPEHLSPQIAASRRTVPASQRSLDTKEIVVRTDQPMSAAVQHLERTMVQAAMQETGSVDEAARRLGLSRKGLYLKRLRFGMEIERPRSEVEFA